MKKINSSRFRGAEFKRNVWRASPAHGEKIEDVQKPEYWSHVGAQLRPLDRIEVVPEDQSYFAELIVTKCDRLYAKTVLLCYIDLNEAEQLGAGQGEDNAPEPLEADGAPTPTANDDYAVEWKGGAKWAVVRKADKEMVLKGYLNKPEAEAALAEYLQKAA